MKYNRFYNIRITILIISFVSFLSIDLSSQKINLSVKVIIDPQDREFTLESYQDQIELEIISMNAILCKLNKQFHFDIVEIIAIGGFNNYISNTYYLAPHTRDIIKSLEGDAKKNPDYSWNFNAINIFLNDHGRGICSFPDDEAILVSHGNFSTGTWLHEIGHYFGLCHTQGCECGYCTGDDGCIILGDDQIDDTEQDAACWNINDISRNSFNKTYENLSNKQRLRVDSTFYNVMSYHSNGEYLTRGQFAKWEETMNKKRAKVLSKSSVGPCYGNTCDKAIEIKSCLRLVQFINPDSVEMDTPIPVECLNSIGIFKGVWYKVLPEDKEIFVDISEINRLGRLGTMVCQIFKGDCGNLRNIFCSNLSSTYGNRQRFQLSNLSTKEYIFIRILSTYPTSYSIFVASSSNSGENLYNSFQTNFGDGSAINKFPAFTGDFNGDKYDDILYIFHDGNELSLRIKASLGNGKYWSYVTTYGDGKGVFNFPTFTGDINGDNKTDLILLFHDGEKLSIRTKLSNGDGSFKSFTDFHGDGKGVFNFPTFTGDINGDNKTDLILLFHDGEKLSIRTKLSNGDGSFKSFTDFHGDGKGVLSDIAISDYNGDGFDDLLLFGNDWVTCGLNIRLKLSNGDGTFCNKFQGSGDGRALLDNKVLIGDFDGNGSKDLAFWGNNWNGNEGLSIRTKLSNEIGCLGFKLNNSVDFDDDGYPIEIDCDDTNPFIHPTQIEIPNNSIDEDCKNDDLVTIQIDIKINKNIFYPNPTNNWVFNKNSIIYEEIEIFDMNGKLISAVKNSGSVSLDFLTNGIYIIRFTNKGSRLIEKISLIK